MVPVLVPMIAMIMGVKGLRNVTDKMVADKKARNAVSFFTAFPQAQVVAPPAPPVALYPSQAMAQAAANGDLGAKLLGQLAWQLHRTNLPEPVRK